MDEVSNMATAAIICFFFADGDHQAGGVRLLFPDETKELKSKEGREKFHHVPVRIDSPAPKGWACNLAPDTPPDVRKKVLEAIEDTRRRLGECDPIWSSW